ncbi:MAG: hypothetical protein QF893_13135 [Alphaproteobacteria bacterium]|nr:hypothetical protein [Alphaproteobacteria bacterium]
MARSTVGERSAHCRTKDHDKAGMSTPPPRLLSLASAVSEHVPRQDVVREAVRRMFAADFEARVLAPRRSVDA